jgi:hypothetical protein
MRWVVEAVRPSSWCDNHGQDRIDGHGDEIQRIENANGVARSDNRMHGEILLCRGRLRSPVCKRRLLVSSMLISIDILVHRFMDLNTPKVVERGLCGLDRSANRLLA